jgi:hypothetical protein
VPHRNALYPCQRDDLGRPKGLTYSCRKASHRALGRRFREFIEHQLPEPIYDEIESLSQPGWIEIRRAAGSLLDVLGDL